MKRGIDVSWMGRPAGLERELADTDGIRYEPIPAAGFSGRGLAGKLVWSWAFLRGTAKALRSFGDREPDAVVAAGGYVGAAPLLAARLRGVPFFLLEQNRIPGRVTRLFASAARGLFLAYPLATELRAETYVTGNPLRPEMVTGGREDDGKTILVLGGSQGARALNLAAVDAAAALPGFRFVILTGRRDYEMVRSTVRSSNCELVDFTDRPGELYRRATIAISRAGGMVLSELAAFGIPAILIPFPYATDRHQDANARYLTAHGAAVVLDQNSLSGLVSEVRRLMDDSERRARIADAVRSLARPQATQDIAERIEQCLAA